MNRKMLLPKVLLYQTEGCSLLAEYLINANFDVTVVNYACVVSEIKKDKHDLYIIDHYQAKNSLLPNLELLKIIRNMNAVVPVLFLSNKQSYRDIIEAYDAGATDYVTRPYNAEVLVRKLKSLIHICGIRAHTVLTEYKLGKYVFNTKDDTLQSETKSVTLTKTESKLLSLLCAYQGEVLPRSVIAEQIWTSATAYNKRSCDVFVCRLRSYINDESSVQIEAIPNVGYTLVIKKQ